MSRDNNLPFPLGTTYSDNGAQSVYSTSAPNLEGKIYRVDGNPSSDSGQEARYYMIVRNSNANAILGATTGQRLLRFGTTAGWWGRKIRGYATSGKDYCVVPDDSLTTSVGTQDLFYVHVKGPAKVKVASLATGAVTFTGGKAVYGARTGGLLLQVAQGQTGEYHPIGSVVETITSGTTGNRSTTVMLGGLMSSAFG
jgi:hypothetical protein